MGHQSILPRYFIQLPNHIPEPHLSRLLGADSLYKQRVHNLSDASHNEEDRVEKMNLAFILTYAQGLRCKKHSSGFIQLRE